MNSKIHHLVLTGGPSAGKSKSLDHIKEKATLMGWRVFTVPEAASIIIGGGVHDMAQLPATRPDWFLEVQRSLLLTQRSLREHFHHLAMSHGGNVLIVYDRGEMDTASYCLPGQWEILLREEGLSLHDVRDSYTMALHLQTSAAADKYDAKSNPSRYETAAQALIADQNTLQAWIGHPHLSIVKATEKPQAKLDDIWAHVEGLLTDSSVESEHKWLLSTEPTADALRSIGARPVEIEQTYLTAPTDEVERRVRHHRQDGSSIYLFTEKYDMQSEEAEGEPCKRVEHEKEISEERYRELLFEQDLQRIPVKKIRWIWAEGGQLWELDVFLSPQGLVLLEAETGGTIQLPEWLHNYDLQDVTHDPEYKNKSLAKRSRPL